jgi:hypothetical protein
MTAPSSPLNVIFHAPKLGTTEVPLGLDGPGTIGWSPAGFTLSGLRHNPNIGSLFGLLGFGVGAMLAGLTGWLISRVQPEEASRGATLSAGAFFVGLFGTIAIGRTVVKPKPVRFTVAWDQVKKVKVDPQSSLASFVVKGEYKGQVQVRVEGTTAQDLVSQWTQVGLSNGLKG